MNSSKQGKKKSKLYIVLIFLLFSVFIFLNRQALFQKFDPEVISRYLRSQDIEDRENVIKDRIFVSDSDIYIASGYLYANGSKPIDYNFQHPPFIKYLFGLSAKYFNLPLLPNIIFGFILLFEVYILANLIFKNRIIGILSSILLMFDPVFKEITTYALLDLGQMVFILAFFISTIIFQGFALQGIFLGLAFASKFYSPIFVFLGIIYLYKLINKQFDLKRELKILAFAFLVFTICYVKSFPFNIFYEQARIIKFMLTHNKAVEWGGVIPMYFGGYLLWPVLFFVNLYSLFKEKFMSLPFVLTLLPATYFILLTFQIPFTRYFILILPFLYISLVKLLTNK